MGLRTLADVRDRGDPTVHHLIGIKYYDVRQLACVVAASRTAMD